MQANLLRIGIITKCQLLSTLKGIFTTQSFHSYCKSLRLFTFTPAATAMSSNDSNLTPVEYYSSKSSESGDKRDHLTTTAKQQREADIHEVTVTELYDISPTVKKIELSLSVPVNPSVRFKAGQWLDMFIPNEKQVGGFSIVSSPTYLNQTGKLELAVKYSEWPPAYWIHTKCQVGMKLSIRVGGDFFFDYEEYKKLDKNSTLIFLAGGVGINPLASMIFQMEDLKLSHEYSQLNFPQRTFLFFSAKSESELLFREKFETIAEKDDNFKLRLFVTGKSPNSLKNNIKGGRIKGPDIKQALATDTANKNTLALLCGPPPFIKDMESVLRSLKVKQIFFETWWS